MRQLFVFVGLALLALYGLLNYYIGLRGWQALGRFVPGLSPRIYWLIFWTIAFAYLFGRAGEKFLPAPIASAVLVGGSYWFVAMIYFFLIAAVVDLARFGLRLAGASLPSVPAYTVGVLALLLVVVLLAYGTVNARRPVVREYEITVPKEVPGREELEIVAVSDLHIDRVMSRPRLQKMVEMVQAQKPDLILLAGDIIDEDPAPFAEKRMDDVMRQLRAPLGVYAVPGNHEYYGGRLDETIAHLEAAGIKVLRDEWVLSQEVYVAGRDERGHGPQQLPPRKKVAELLQGVDRKRPVILLTHQPVEVEEAARAGVDLMVSGHTHAGQFWPIGLITSRIFREDWGLFKEGNFHLVVSSGYGTWGPPVRIGNRPEIVVIKVKFRRGN